MEEIGYRREMERLEYQRKELRKEIKMVLEKARKKRDKKPQPKVTRLVDRKDPWFSTSYHDQMQELARQEEESYLTGA